MLHSRIDPFTGTNPFADMRRIQHDMNRLFEGLGTSHRTRGFPAINFWTGSDSIVMTAELPGMSQDDIDLTVQDTMVTLRGEFTDHEEGDNITWHRRERPKGKFSRSIELPFRVDPDHIEARFENGVLTMEMQRPEDEKPKRIEIKS